MNEDELCSCNIIDEEKLSKARSEMLEIDFIRKLSEFYKTMGDPTRITIISALMKREMCVCDIASLLNMSQSSISHQLKALKSARLVKWRREGKSIYYSLDDKHVEEIIAVGIAHIKEE